jgi:N-terminal domain of toast_rack, DUF2154
MNRHTRLTLFLLITTLTLIITACKPKVDIGTEQTFIVDVPNPASGSPMKVTLDLAVPQGTLALAGGTQGLIRGGITYNAADYEPEMTNGDDGLLIRQAEPGRKSVVISVQKNLINKWDLSVGAAPMNFEIRLENGEYTIEFKKSMPAEFNATINAGVGKVNLHLDPNLAAQVIIGEHTDLLEVTTRGDWTQTGDVYETGNGSASLTITVNLRGGELNLDNK